MSHFFAFFTREQLESSLLLIWRRFPIATILIALISACWYAIVNGTLVDENAYFRLIFTGIVTFFLSVGAALYFESQKNQKYKIIFMIFPILYGVLFYMTVDIRESMSLQSITYFILHLVGFLSLIFYAPYIVRILEGEEGSIEYTNYFSRIAWVFLMSFIVGISLLLLGFIAIASVDALFSLTWDEGDVYGNWAVTALTLMAPIYALIQFPRFGEIASREYETNRFFSFLIRYVATPSIYVYFAILYAYSLKVLLNFSDWPKGIVTWLVIGFSTFGYLTYIFSKSYDGGAIVSTFRRYFPYVVIPQIAMLAYAIYLRIAQYDLTMNRYFVVIFGLWLLGISLYYIFSKRKSLVLIPASLSIISLIISLGPWSVFSYPQTRQEARLIRNLEAAKILQNGNIVPLQSERDISKELSTEIAAGIEYLCDFDDCARIRALFPEQVAKAEAKSRNDWQTWNKDNASATYPGLSRWEIQSAIVTELRVQRYPYDETTREFPEQEYLSYNIDQQKGQYPLDVRGYDLVTQVISSSQKKSYPESGVYPQLSYDADTELLTYESAQGVLDTYPLKLSEKLRDSATISPVDQSELTFVVADDKREIKLLLQNLMVKNPKYTGPKTKDMYLYSASGYALIKMKK